MIFDFLQFGTKFSAFLLNSGWGQLSKYFLHNSTIWKLCGSGISQISQGSWNVTIFSMEKISQHDLYICVVQYKVAYLIYFFCDIKFDFETNIAYLFTLVGIFLNCFKIIIMKISLVGVKLCSDGKWTARWLHRFEVAIIR